MLHAVTLQNYIPPGRSVIDKKPKKAKMAIIDLKFFYSKIKIMIEKIFYLIRLPLYVLGAVCLAITVVPFYLIFFCIAWAFGLVLFIITIPFVFIGSALKNDTEKIKTHFDLIKFNPFKIIKDTIKEEYEKLHHWLEHGQK